ncbi:MAG: TerC family protein [Bacteroidetes bacterium]|nr:TerC family protein [Bacteroidota bacterium]
MHSWIPWTLFNVFVLLMLVIDLRVFHRHAHEITIKEAVAWSAVWIGLALLFNVGLYFWLGPQPALEFLTGYLIEKSLSVDNLFVFLLIFSYFKVDVRYQHKVLYWGILGALVLRALFIATGVTLIGTFHWIIYLFGGFLIITGIRMSYDDEKQIHPEKNPVLKLLRRVMPISPSYVEGRFFIKENGRLLATPLFVVLIVVETTDLVFAVDSIPAILAITLDPFIVFTSNVFAILGLRALFFALAGAMKIFRYLNYGLSAILVFIGAKMLVSGFFEIPVGVALGVVGAILILSVLASILKGGSSS